MVIGSEPAPRILTLATAELPPDRYLGLERDGLMYLALGLFLAVAVMGSSILSYFSGMITTMIHELGHSAGGWLYGYPSVPSFDFIYGGGVTLQHERAWWLAAGVALLLVWFMFKYRRNRVTLLLLAGMLAAYTVTALTPSHQGFILAMGHGAELLFAGVFLYRALSGSKISHAFMRPVYAFISLFVILDNLRFSYLLAFDDTHRYHYESVSAMGFQMDFSRLADNYLNISISSIAAIFFALCLLTPVLSYVYLRKSTAMVQAVVRLRRR